MAKITQADVDYVANLANLELTPEERERMVKDLDAILGYIDRLNELDTTNVPPMTQALVAPASSPSYANQGAGLREDSPRPSLSHEEAMKNAPDTDGQYFRVPRVIER